MPTEKKEVWFPHGDPRFCHLPAGQPDQASSELSGFLLLLPPARNTHPAHPQAPMPLIPLILASEPELVCLLLLNLPAGIT